MSNLLDIEDLKVNFYTDEGVGHAVNGVSFGVGRGETVGVVGESGCGKSVTALSILRLVPRPGRIDGGKIIFDGADLMTLSEEEMRKVRGDSIAMIFQEPMTALNPVFTIGDQIAEGVLLHRGVSKSEAKNLAIESLKSVGVPAPEKRIRDYPHQLSGGLRQRAMIAMALVLSPKLILADEPTTALDVTIQAQILDLMSEMREATKISFLLITHDLGVVAETCDRVVVMYAGRIVESSPVTELFNNPKHPYTEGLLESIPTRSKAGQRLKEIPGSVPSLFDLPKGCSFAPRCPKVMDTCRIESPPNIAVDGCEVECFLY